MNWRVIGLAFSLVWFGAVAGVAWAKWAGFLYRSFDLAFYVQALWLGVGGGATTILGVPLLGNHFDPIVFAFLPVFRVIPHPLVLIAGQTALLAAMASIGHAYCRGLGFGKREAWLLGLSLLVCPAVIFGALHEFHPETLAATFLLCLLLARQRRVVWAYWLSLALVFSCKENLPLVVGALACVDIVALRKDGRGAAVKWGWIPLAVSIGWLAIWVFVLSPRWNAGGVSFGQLYGRLGSSVGEALANLREQPGMLLGALGHGLSGSLLWGTLLAFAGLAILRPRYLFAALPLLLQHFLSFRSSEWTIYFHYAVPLVPLFWVGAVEAVAARAWLRPRWWLVPLASVAASLVLGVPASVREILTARGQDGALHLARARAVAGVPADASVTAGLPYLSHLAARAEVYSLHFVLKGLKTLGTERVQLPAPTERVVIDYADEATFNAPSGFFHPVMRMRDGTVIPSSAKLLHDHLSAAAWESMVVESVVCLRRVAGNGGPDAPAAPGTAMADRVLAPGTRLEAIGLSLAPAGGAAGLVVRSRFRVDAGREIFPWMLLVFSGPDGAAGGSRVRGWPAIERREGVVEDVWQVSPPAGLPRGRYMLRAVFVDQDKALGARLGSGSAGDAMLATVELGGLEVGGGN